MNSPWHHTKIKVTVSLFLLFRTKVHSKLSRVIAFFSLSKHMSQKQAVKGTNSTNDANTI